MRRRETVVVTGATGTVGRALLAELTGHRELTVRALSRNKAATLPDDIQLCVGDFVDRGSLDRAMDGATRLFLLATGNHLAVHDRAAVDAARRASIRHIVKLSALGVGYGGTDPITVWHRAGEDQVRSSGVAWTMIRPTGFMTNALNWSYAIKAVGTVFAPFADGRTALIDPRDVARVAGAVLTQDGHEGQIYELTGPEALGPADQVRILSEVLGRPIAYAEVEPDAAQHQLEQNGMTVDLADAVIELLASAREPWNAQPLPTVERLIGRPPADFRTWASDHQGAFMIWT